MESAVTLRFLGLRDLGDDILPERTLGYNLQVLEEARAAQSHLALTIMATNVTIATWVTISAAGNRGSPGAPRIPNPGMLASHLSHKEDLFDS